MIRSRPDAFGADDLAPTSEAPSSRQRTFPRLVTGLDVLLTFIAVVLLPAAVAVGLVVAGVAFEQRWLLGLVIPLATLVAGAGTWSVLIRRGWSWRDLGYVRASRSLWHLLWEVPLTWFAALVLTALLGTLAGITPSDTDGSTSSTTDALELGIVVVLVGAVCITIVMPALEEILFRRVLFGWFEHRLGLTTAIVGSALVFGVVHVAPPVMLLQLLIGLSAATLVRAHRTLWASLALHGFNNGIVTVTTLTILF